MDSVVSSGRVRGNTLTGLAADGSEIQFSWWKRVPNAPGSVEREPFRFTSLREESMFDFDVQIEEAVLRGEQLTTKWSRFEARLAFHYDTSGNKKLHTSYTCKAIEGFQKEVQVMSLSQFEYEVDRAEIKIESVWLAPEQFVEMHKGRKEPWEFEREGMGFEVPTEPVSNTPCVFGVGPVSMTNDR